MFYSLMMILLFPLCGYIGDIISLEISFKLIGVIGLVITIVEFLVIRKNNVK